MHLSLGEIRVLGALIEKEITTPEYYPLSLNALQAASNQRSSRDPVLTLSEEDVRQALHGLQNLGLVNPSRDSRVPKYEHRARTVLNLRRDETAILCLLLLRGPQTPGELRSRADRLHSFDDLTAVTATLDRLAGRSAAIDADALPSPDNTGPLAVMLARQPGARESRYAHLLGAQTEPLPPRSLSPAEGQASSLSNPEGTTNTDSVNAELATLRASVTALAERVSLLEQRGAPSPSSSNSTME